MNKEELIEKAKIPQDLGAEEVEIVGRWVWARFGSKPSEEARQALKDAEYHWNRKRGIWQFAGVPCRFSRAGNQELRLKHGSFLVTESV